MSYLRGSQTVRRGVPGSRGLFTGAPRSFIIRAVQRGGPRVSNVPGPGLLRGPDRRLIFFSYTTVNYWLSVRHIRKTRKDRLLDLSTNKNIFTLSNANHSNRVVFLSVTFTEDRGIELKSNLAIDSHLIPILHRIFDVSVIIGNQCTWRSRVKIKNRHRFSSNT